MAGLVFSSYTNAYAIYRGAKALGVPVMSAEDGPPVFPLPARTADGKIDWLFFTEEDSLRQALDGRLPGKFLPPAFPRDLLDDKWAFAHWLETRPHLTPGLAQWPLSQVDAVALPCLLKAKHSWVDGRKLPRGWICRSRAEIDAALGEIAALGLRPDHFFFQAWLGDAACEVISVCGFHDAGDAARNLTAVVARVSSHTAGLSCSAAVETIDDRWGLQRRTQDMLDALDFVGPYELEYLVVGDTVRALELNPRFWMQHALFLARGNGLMKRYLGQDTQADRRQSRVEDLVWVDGLHLVQAACLLRLGFVGFVLKKRLFGKKSVLIWPSVPMAAYVWLRILVRGCKKILPRLFSRLLPRKRPAL